MWEESHRDTLVLWGICFCMCVYLCVFGLAGAVAKRKGGKSYSILYSQGFSHLSTNQALPFLAS